MQTYMTVLHIFLFDDRDYILSNERLNKTEMAYKVDFSSDYFKVKGV